MRQHPVLVFFLLTYVFSWTIEIPIALSVRSVIAAQIPLPVHYLASFGPGVAALIVVLTADGVTGMRRLFAGLGRWRVGWGYAFFAIVLPLLLFAVAVLASRLIQRAWPDLRLLGDVDYLSGIGILPALGLWLLTFGLGEELGWRGFALPRLQATFSAYTASLLLGVVWAGWHLPAFFYRDTYIAMGLLAGFPMLLISILAASVTLTWLYNGTGGSLLMVVLFHGLFDFFSVSSAGGSAAPIVMSALIVFWAVRVVKVYGPATLAPVAHVIAAAPEAAIPSSAPTRGGPIATR
jgi:membrane protease YdiL (CAAX protease family)